MPYICCSVFWIKHWSRDSKRLWWKPWLKNGRMENQERGMHWRNVPKGASGNASENASENDSGNASRNASRNSSQNAHRVLKQFFLLWIEYRMRLLLAYNFANKGLHSEYFPLLRILLGQYFSWPVRALGLDRLLWNSPVLFWKRSVVEYFFISAPPSSVLNRIWVTCLNSLA